MIAAGARRIAAAVSLGHRPFEDDDDDEDERPIGDPDEDEGDDDDDDDEEEPMQLAPPERHAAGRAIRAASRRGNGASPVAPGRHACC